MFLATKKMPISVNFQIFTVLVKSPMAHVAPLEGLKCLISLGKMGLLLEGKQEDPFVGKHDIHCWSTT